MPNLNTLPAEIRLRIILLALPDLTTLNSEHFDFGFKLEKEYTQSALHLAYSCRTMLYDLMELHKCEVLKPLVKSRLPAWIELLDAGDSNATSTQAILQKMEGCEGMAAHTVFALWVEEAFASIYEENFRWSRRAASILAYGGAIRRVGIVLECINRCFEILESTHFLDREEHRIYVGYQHVIQRVPHRQETGAKVTLPITSNGQIRQRYAGQ